MNWLFLSQPRTRLLALAALSAFGLLGCGGGGSDTPTITTPVINTAPQDAALQEGADARFSVTASGASLNYEWQLAGQPVANATGSTLTLRAVTLAQNGAQVTVIVSNPAGSVRASARLMVTSKPVPPLITQQPESLTVIEGTPVSFSVAATGSEPMRFQWFRNEIEVVGGTGATFRSAAARRVDAGRYHVQISNAAGQVSSAVVELIVQQTPIAPTITRQPQSTAVTEDGRLSLNVGAQGTGPLSYLWRKDGQDISGATDATYTKEPVSTADAGRYSVIVSNTTGSIASLTAVVTVTALPKPPTIRTQPQNVQVIAGNSAVFRVVADGTPPMTYQWRRDGQPIAGATRDSFTLTTATIQDAGARISVQVTNQRAQATSEEAVLTVRQVQVAAGTSHTLAMTADGRVFAWGGNARGELGNGEITFAVLQPMPVKANPDTPLKDVVAIAASQSRSMALRRDGSVLAWGDNQHGLLSDGTTDTQPFPVPVLTRAGGTPLTGVLAIGAGSSHSLALLHDGTVLAWGITSDGVLGNPAANGKFPASVVDAAGSPIRDIVAISAGYTHSLALRADGTVLAWGSNISGELGDGTTLNSRGFAAPVKDAKGQPLRGIRSVATGLLSSYALLTDGTVLAWGANLYGQLGNGTTDFTATPVKVVNAKKEPLAAIQTIQSGMTHALALDVDGCLHSWGGNFSYELGVAEFTVYREHSAPVEIAQGARQCNILGLGVGANHNIAITRSGDLIGWGDNGGRLGNGEHGRSQLPTAVLLPRTMF